MCGRRARTRLTFFLAGHLLITGAFGWSLHALIPHSCGSHAAHTNCSADVSCEVVHGEPSKAILSNRSTHSHAGCHHDHRLVAEKAPIVAEKAPNAPPAGEKGITVQRITAGSPASATLQTLDHPDSCSLCQFLRQLNVHFAPGPESVSAAFARIELLPNRPVFAATERLYSPRGPPLSWIA